MRVLLINPNTFQKPPIIPIGLEYLLTYLRKAGHEAKILDLCFSENPSQEIENLMKSEKYDLFGITIRNIDSVIYHNNEFFLDEIKKLLKILKNHEVPIVLGGTGFSSMPEEVLEYLDAEFGIFGPGETALLKLLNDLNNKKANYKLLDGWKLYKDEKLVHLRGADLDYSKYLENDSILGFETQKGCPHSCSYCVEASTGLQLRPISVVVEEIKHLVEQGYDRFHLCDAEFNLNLEQSMAFCRELIKRDLKMEWALYMRPAPYNEELFRLIKESNGYLITLTIESDKNEQQQGNYSLEDLEKIINYCKKHEIKLAMDLLIGFPNEPRESIEEMINFLKKHRPNSVGVSFYFRLYKYTGMGKLIQAKSEIQNDLSRPLKSNEDFIEPIFFTQLDLEFVREIIGQDELFRIEGFQAGVNYQRV